MNWFRKKNRESGDRDIRKPDIRSFGDQGQKPSVPDPLIPGYPLSESPNPRISFSYVIPVLLVLFTAFLMIHTAAVVSDPANPFIQADWADGAMAILLGGVLLGLFALVENGRSGAQGLLNGLAVEFEGDLFNAGGRAGGGRYRSSRGQRPRWPAYQLKLQSFFASRWLDKECDKKKYDSDNREKNAHPARQFNKEFACQGDGKYGFRDIREITRRKFAPGVCDEVLHTLDIYHINNGSSNVFIQSYGAGSGGLRILALIFALFGAYSLDNLLTFS